MSDSQAGHLLLQRLDRRRVFNTKIRQRTKTKQGTKAGKTRTSKRGQPTKRAFREPVQIIKSDHAKEIEARQKTQLADQALLTQNLLKQIEKSQGEIKSLKEVITVREKDINEQTKKKGNGLASFSPSALSSMRQDTAPEDQENPVQSLAGDIPTAEADFTTQKILEERKEQIRLLGEKLEAGKEKGRMRRENLGMEIEDILGKGKLDIEKQQARLKGISTGSQIGSQQLKEQILEERKRGEIIEKRLGNIINKKNRELEQREMENKELMRRIHANDNLGRLPPTEKKPQPRIKLQGASTQTEEPIQVPEPRLIPKEQDTELEKITEQEPERIGGLTFL